MGSELDTPGIEGRVIEGGMAQSVTREGDLVRVKLTRMPGQPLTQTTYGAMTSIPLPEPVRVEAGQWIAVDMEWLPEPDRETAGQPMHMRYTTTVTKAITGPSAVHPGTLQGWLR